MRSLAYLIPAALLALGSCNRPSREYSLVLCNDATPYGTLVRSVDVVRESKNVGKWADISAKSYKDGKLVETRNSGIVEAVNKKDACKGKGIEIALLMPGNFSGETHFKIQDFDTLELEVGTFESNKPQPLKIKIDSRFIEYYENDWHRYLWNVAYRWDQNTHSYQRNH